MIRDPAALAEGEFDVVVVGGGILGVCAAWEASLAGLRVALVERGDFCSGTSANSLKILHGGLRYLQTFDVSRARESHRERSFWLNAAPHLSTPIPFVVPLGSGILEQPVVAGVGLRAYRLLTGGRSMDAELAVPIPPPEVVDGSCATRLAPEGTGAVGPAIRFFDGLMYSPERIVMLTALAAGEAGAIVCNHVSFEGLGEPGTAVGVAWVRDLVTGERIPVRTRVVLNVAGPWSGQVAGSADHGQRSTIPDRQCLALNIVTRRPAPPAAFGFPSGGRRLFVVPWRGQAMFGTAYHPEPAWSPESDGSRDETKEFARRFVTEINQALPAYALEAEDITLIHAGHLPLAGQPSLEADHESASAALEVRDEAWLVEHPRTAKPHVISAGTVKFTMGRRVAESAIRAVHGTLGLHAPTPSPTLAARLPGAPAVAMEVFVAQAVSRHGGTVDPEVVEHLAHWHGERCGRVLDLMREIPDGDRRLVPETPVTVGELAYSAREEMAVTPDDLVGRSEIAARGWVTPEVLREAEAILGAHAPETGP